MVQHIYFCMLLGLFSSQTPYHHFEREWILTHHSKEQLTNHPKFNLLVSLRIVTFSCGGLLLHVTEVLFKSHVCDMTSFLKPSSISAVKLMLWCHSVSIQFLIVGLFVFLSVFLWSKVCLHFLKKFRLIEEGNLNTMLLKSDFVHCCC